MEQESQEIEMEIEGQQQARQQQQMQQHQQQMEQLMEEQQVVRQVVRQMRQQHQQQMEQHQQMQQQHQQQMEQQYQEQYQEQMQQYLVARLEMEQVQLARQESYIKGWLSKILLEEWRGELEASRYQWLKKGTPELWIKFMTGFKLLDLLKAHLQIELENRWLFKRKQR